MQGNKDPSAYANTPDWCVNLSDRGHEQAKDAIEQIRPLVSGQKVLLYYSPYARSRQTAEHLFPSNADNMYGCEVLLRASDPRLREQEFAGSFQTLTCDGQVVTPFQERKEYGKFFFRFAGGESGADVFDRVGQFMNTLFRDIKHHYSSFQEDGVVVIVAHGLLNRLFLMRWLHWDVETFNASMNPDNADLLVLERSGR